MGESERFETLQRLFHEAAKLEGAARSELLDRRCETDPELRARIEALLDADRRSREGSFLERPLEVGSEAGATGDRLFPDPRRNEEPVDRSPVRYGADGERFIGPYRVLRAIGRGGMSTVYLAVQEEEGYHRRVAIKVVRQGLEGAETLRRLRTEQQILAALDHPGIARLLHSGTTDEDVPYFVLEYVDGLRVDEYCDRRRLSVSQRLRLFLEICEAVRYAHGNLVVHRDIKPGNILVTEQGRPKLLDFGIAKLLNPELGLPQIAPTVTWLRMMTPYYASPEQALGQPINTSTDIYSLGVLLYCLLTGCLPYRLGERTPQEVERAVVEQEPERPSVAVAEPRELCLEGARGSAEEIAALRAVRPEALSRRLRGDLDNILLKALRKEPQHRYGSVDQLAEDIRRHLDGLPVIARQGTAGYYLGKFLRRNGWPVAVTAAFLVLVLGFATFVRLQSKKIQAQAEEIARERDQARLEANRLRRFRTFVARLFHEAGVEEAGGRTLTVRKVLDRGSEILDGERELEVDSKAYLINSLGYVYHHFGALEAAEELHRRAWKSRREIYGEDHLEFAESCYDLAEALGGQGRFAESEELARRALAIYRAQEHAKISNSLAQVAFLRYSQGDYAGAEPLYREALEIRRRDFPPDAGEVVESIGHLSVVLYAQGNYEGAEVLISEALEIHRRNFGPESHDVAYALNTLGAVHYEKGELAEAESKFREALRIWAKSRGPRDPQLVYPLQGLGRLYLARGDLEQAEAVIREGASIWREAGAESHWRLAQMEALLGTSLVRQGRFEEAEALLAGSYRRLNESRGAGHRDTRMALESLIEIYRGLGNAEEEERYRGLLESASSAGQEGQ